MHLLRPSAKALVDRRPAARRTPSREGAVNLRAATALNTQLAAVGAGAADVRARTRSSRLGSKTSRRRCSSATRCSPGSRPSRPTATTSRWRSATSRACSPRTSASARSRARASCSPRTARTTRASRPRRPPTGRRSKKPSHGTSTIIDNNHVHVNPYPNVAGPGQPRSLRSGQRDLRPGQSRDRQRARRQRRGPTAKSPPANRTCSAKSTRARQLKDLGSRRPRRRREGASK